MNPRIPYVPFSFFSLPIPNRLDMPRLFVAIDMPDAHRAALATLHDETLPARWTRPEQMHLTLRFIGDVAPALVAQIDQALSEIRADAFSLHLHGLGVFPSMRRPRVLFAALAHQPALIDLHQRIESRLHATGVAPDPKPFHPHVTLARLRNAAPRAVRAYVRRHQPFSLDPFEAAAYILYESTLRPEGALHRPHNTFTLKSR